MELLEMPVDEQQAETEETRIEFDERAFQLWQQASRTDTPPEEA